MAIIQIIPAGDLRLENGNAVILSGAEYIRQLVQNRFRFFLAEWFLDLREGVPYYRDVLVKSPDPHVVRSVFRQVLRDTPGVREIDRFEIVLDTAAREIRFSFAAQTESGPVTVSPEDRAFVVQI